ncbi:MAG TPA: ABC transporter substrate-binding protein [Candidatus Paceibacterota bacterium]|nr:ABC transporter substrate-binding protein [Candidatus Paceibacterota bacterium]
MSKTAKWIVAIVVIILIVAGVWYWQTNKVSTPVETGPIKIGFIGPLTGDVASIGQNNKAATELAVEVINANGGVNGRQIEMIWEDGRCDGATAATAAQKLVNVDKVSAIIGGLCSGESISSAPIAEQGKVVMLSPLSSSPDLTLAGDYFFRNYPSDSYQGVKAAELATKDLQAKNIAVLACQDDWCAGIEKVFTEKAQQLGANIVATERYDDKTSKDLKTQLTKIKSSNPDLIYFLGYSDSTIIGLKQIKELSINAKILGGDAWDDPKIVESAGQAAEGIIYLKPVTPENADFVASMKSKTGGEEITIGSAQAYDAANILAQVMGQVGSDSSKIKSALYKVKNYQGVSGVISFDSNGDLTTANYVAKTVLGGKVIDLVK